MKAPLQALGHYAPLTALVSCLQEQKKMEGIIATMQRKHNNEVADLHATADQLLKVGFPLNMHACFYGKLFKCFNF